MFSTEEKDIQQFFEELKANDQRMAPGFDATFQAAIRKKRDRLWYARRAAAIAIIVVASFALMWFVPEHTPRSFSGGSISQWSSPVDHSSLYPDIPKQSISNWQSPTQFTISTAPVVHRDLSSWKSPTDFLLTTSKKQQ